MEVWRRLVVGCAAAAVAVFLVLGVADTGPVSLLMLVVPLGAGALFLRLPRGRPLPDGWLGATVAAPYGARGELPSQRRVALALGRVETRELARSGSFGVGIGFCVLVLLLFGWVWPAESIEPWEGMLLLTPWFAHPLVGMTVLGAHRAVTRARRDGATELFESCPAAPATRTAGHLLAAVAPVVTLAALFVALVALVAWRAELIYGPIPAETIFDVAAAVALGAGGVALGVALGRWVSFPLAPVVVVVGVAFGTLALSNVGGHDWNPYVYLGTAPTIEGPSPVFVHRPAAWHLLWILALVGVIAIVAVARHRRDRPVQLAAAAAVVFALVAGFGVTRPIPTGAAERIADLVAHPEAHQRCDALAPEVEVCLFDLHRPLLDLLEVRVRNVAAALPAGHRTVTMRQVYDSELADLPPEVRELLTPADLLRPSAEVPIGFGSDVQDPVLDPGFDLALAVTGLPVRTGPDELPLVVAGQARGVVALWLASRGLEGKDLRRVVNSAASTSLSAYERGSLEVGDCSEPSVVWSAQDLRAVRAIVHRTDVEAVLHARWDHWLDPATGTDELLAVLGESPVGPFDDVVPEPGNPC